MMKTTYDKNELSAPDSCLPNFSLLLKLMAKTRSLFVVTIGVIVLLQQQARCFQAGQARRPVATPRWLASVSTAQTKRLISISEKARKHITGMEKEAGWVHVRLGVRDGGCSGMSYVMEPCRADDVKEQDEVVDFDEGIRCAIDPESIPYVTGLELDYSDALVGGGFAFLNPNAETTCSCGNSFNVEKVKSLCEDRTDDEQQQHEQDMGR